MKLYPPNFLTYFLKRSDVSSEQPPPIPGPPPERYQLVGKRLVAPTIPSLSEVDARSNAALDPLKSRPSVFTAILTNESHCGPLEIFGATRLIAGESVLVDGEEIKPLVLKQWAVPHGWMILLLFAWLGDLVLEFNAVDYLTALPDTAQSLVDRAISRICRDPKFQGDYKACSHTKAGKALYHTTENWSFDPTTAKDNGFIGALRTELILLADAFNVVLILKLRNKAKDLVANSVFGGLSMSRTFEMPEQISAEALAILRKIGRDVELIPQEDTVKTQVITTLCLDNQKAVYLYKCDAVRELTNTLLSGLGLLNVARGITFSARGVTFPASARGNRVAKNPVPVVRPAALPAACMAMAATFLEIELRILSQLRDHFGLRITPISTMQRFSRDEYRILAAHRQILVLSNAHHSKQLSSSHSVVLPTPELRKLVSLIEATRRRLDSALNIFGINATLEAQSKLQKLPIWS